jgi:endoglucanase
MKMFFTRLGVRALSILSVGVCLCAVANVSAAPLTFLHTRGEDIIDENGRKVMLRGVGLGNWLLPEGYMWKFGANGDRPRKIEKLVSDLIGPEKAAAFWKEFRRNYITEADIQKIAELGFNSVRPALNARLFLTEGENCQYVDEGFELLDNLVGWCRKHQVYVIIDMHAAPGGQTGANIDDSAKDEPELFTDKRNQDRLVDLWVKLAQRYKDEPAVAGYDLLNEPLPRRTGAEEKFKSELEPLYKRITAAIRAVDKRHMITVEGADWANDWSVFASPFDDNLVYQFHFYCWDRPTKLNRIDQYLAHRKRLGAPVWVGETGEKDNAIYWGTTEYFEAHNIGWSFWPWKKMEANNAPCSIKRPQGWDSVSAYSRGREKPSAEIAQKAFDELARNVLLENCVFQPEVVNALFRRIPGKVEAENYGQEGPNISYQVHDGAANSKFYRTSEPVPVVELEGGMRRDSGQAVQLRESEWTVYTIESLAAKDYSGVCRVKADDPASVIEFRLGGFVQEVALNQASWTEVNLKPIAFQAGPNRLKLLVTKGAATVDWISFR